jgi:hypothetical protein
MGIYDLVNWISEYYELQASPLVNRIFVKTKRMGESWASGR